MAKSGWKRGSTPRDLQRRLLQKASKVDRNLGNAVKAMTERVVEAGKTRAIVSKRVSRQDAPGGRTLRPRRTPLRKKIDRRGLTGVVRLGSFWTPARTRASKALHRKYGLDRNLLRNGLFVRSETRKRLFSREPGLYDWAVRHYQYRRHQVRLRDTRIRRDLVLRPAIKQEQANLRKLFQVAVRAGLFK